MTDDQLTVIQNEIWLATHLIGGTVFVAAAMVLRALDSPWHTVAIIGAIVMVVLTVRSLVVARRLHKVLRDAEST